MDTKIFTYEEACNLLEAVRDRTLAASERLETLRAQAEQLGSESEPGNVSEWIENVVRQWTAEILALGALPKGVFTVDFDSGRGFYYCWTLNEPVLDHFHRYEEGFARRQPLPEEEKAETPRVLN